MRKKVFAYICFREKVLVFRQPKYPEAGIQLPKGSVEIDESLETALFREIREETLLVPRLFRPCRFLGSDIFDMTPFGIDEVQQRFFYFLECKHRPRETWSNYEVLATGEKVLYDFFWLSKQEIKDLPFQQGVFL